MASSALALAALATAVCTSSGAAFDHITSSSSSSRHHHHVIIPHHGSSTAYAGGGPSALDLSLNETASPHELALLRSSGVNYCKFANGTRQVPLATGFFGPEPCVFGDGMVLRASDSAGGAGASAGAVIWGFGAAAEKITLTIDGAPSGSTTSDANGRWEITVKVPASAKASVLEFSGATKKATLSNVLFGDVWLCSGQSNMDFSVAASGGGGCFAQNETVALAASGEYNDIRLMHGGAANGHWWNASSNGGNDVAHFSAVCFLSALAMKQHIPSHKDRPIGLVQSSVGGTVIEMWMSPQALEQCLPANESVSGAGCAAGSQFNSNLYYELIDPLAPLSLTGTLWYQGESNVPQNAKPDFLDYYACLEKAKIRSWRKVFRSPEMFYAYVSLAAYGSSDNAPSERTSDPLPRMRLDQNAALTLPLTGCALGLDLGDDGKLPVTPRSGRHGGIHPRNKTEIGRRLALSYAKVGLGLQVVATGPEFESASIAGNIVSLKFSNTGEGGLALSPTEQCSTHARPALSSPADCCSATPRLRTKGTNLPADGGVPFEIQLSNSTFVLPEKTTVQNSEVSLVVPMGLESVVVGVRYCYQGYPFCVLRNSAGLPAMPFLANATKSLQADAEAEK